VAVDPSMLPTGLDHCLDTLSNYADGSGREPCTDKVFPVSRARSFPGLFFNTVHQGTLPLASPGILNDSLRLAHITTIGLQWPHSVSRWHSESNKRNLQNPREYPHQLPPTMKFISLRSILMDILDVSRNLTSRKRKIRRYLLGKETPITLRPELPPPPRQTLYPLP
jgi:hypothetical protein